MADNTNDNESNPSTPRSDDSDERLDAANTLASLPATPASIKYMSHSQTSSPFGHLMTVTPLGGLSFSVDMITSPAGIVTPCNGVLENMNLITPGPSGLESFPNTSVQNMKMDHFNMSSVFNSSRMKSPVPTWSDDPQPDRAEAKKKLFDDDESSTSLSRKRPGDPTLASITAPKRIQSPCTPKRVKNPIVDPNGSGALKVAANPCTCKKTKCLKLYCDCFATQVYCTDSCKCADCRNTEQHEAEREEAVKTTLARNPKAFYSKIEQTADSPSSNASTPGQHNKGCHCKKSFCLKKYCECFNLNVHCSERCRCKDCKNQEGNEELKARRQQQLQNPGSPGTPDSESSASWAQTKFVARPSQLSKESVQVASESSAASIDEVSKSSEALDSKDTDGVADADSEAPVNNNKAVLSSNGDHLMQSSAFLATNSSS